MDEMLKIGAIAVVATLCAVVVKKNVQELGIVLTLVAGVLILTLAFDAITSVRTLIDRLGELAGLSPTVISPVIKTVGVAIVTRLCAEVCRDAKEGGIASFVEVAGVATGLLITLPLLEAVLEMVVELL